MRTSLAACLIASLTVSTATAQNLVLEPYTVRDPVAIHRDAVTFLKPKGWTVSGGVRWYVNQSHQACLEVKVSDPKSMQQIETFPWCNFTHITNPVIPMQIGYNYMGNIVMPVIEDPREAVRQITIPNLRKGARITAYKEMPDVAKTLSAANGGARVRAGKIRIEYAINGQDIEEDIYLSIYVVSANLGGNTVSHLWGPAWTPFSLRAAKGELDAATPLMMASVQSAVANPRWFAEVNYVKDLFQERMAKGIQNAVDISNTIRQNSDAIFKMYSDSYWNRQASQDRVFRNFSNYIRGVTPYHNPFQQNATVNLPNTHQYAWGSSTGGYTLSNDPNFDPNQGSSHTWKLLQPSRAKRG